MKHYKKNEKGESITEGRLVISGFSYGGVLAMHLARRLEKKNIKVDFMVLLDPAASALFSGGINRVIPSNTDNVNNIYQEEWNNKVGSYGAPVKREDGSEKGIWNIRVFVNHEQVDDVFARSVVAWVLEFLNKKQE